MARDPLQGRHAAGDARRPPRARGARHRRRDNVPSGPLVPERGSFRSAAPGICPWPAAVLGPVTVDPRPGPSPGSRGRRSLIGLTLALGIGYPLVVTGLSQALFPRQANGSLVYNNGRPASSALLGQSFTDARGKPRGRARTRNSLRIVLVTVFTAPCRGGFYPGLASSMPRRPWSSPPEATEQSGRGECGHRD
ncbi:MAG TPA: potassium-transporting ATPase subunit C [Trebonia sp.]